MTQITQPGILSDFKHQAIAAHYGTSFSPERRGENMINEFGNELLEDIDHLKKNGVPEEMIEEYVSKYKRFFSSYLGAKSRCISSMIAGPSNFPVRRAEKANRSEQRHWEVFREWRKKATKAVIRKSQPPKTFQSEIERYEAELLQRTTTQEYMKKINKAYQTYKRKGEAFNMGSLTENERNMIKNFVPEYSWIKGPYAGYQMSNNLANIKRIEQRIAELKEKESRANNVGSKEFPFPGGVVVLNYELDRVQIKHDKKPSRSELDEMKKKGLGSFNWSPSNMAWQMKLTSHAIYKANCVTGLNIEK